MAAFADDDDTVHLNLTEEEMEQNLLEQRDEILALESIFEDTEKIKILHSPKEHEESAEEQHTDSPSSGISDVYNILLTVECSLEDGIGVEAWKLYNEEEDQEEMEVAACATVSNQQPTFQRSFSGKRLCSNFRVHHLSPLSLQLVLPKSYPSKSPPAFTLSCLWLDIDQLTVLCKELDKQWEEMQGMPIMYLWMDWLQNHTLSTLGLETNVHLVPHLFDDTSSAQRDFRALPECDSLENGLVKMLRFDYEEKQRQFQQNNQTCEVCFDEKMGNQFFRLSECEHHFCWDCMTSYCDFHVKEGTIQQLTCPTPKCSTALPSGVLQTVLGEEEYERWERLLLQRTLDMMGDVVWCPRCNSPVIREEDESLKLAHCTTCLYSFCTQCNDPWHQGRACVTSDGEEEGKQAKSKLPRKQRTKDSNRMNRMSSKWVSQFTKRCPKCHSPIEKDGGCNMVHCVRCGTQMCWLCGQKAASYDHFDKCSLFGTTFTSPRYAAQRPVPEGAQKVQRHVQQNPERVKDRLCACPSCHQRNLKENRNNHIRCFSCKVNFCFLCKTVIKPPIMNHYTYGSACVQHSD